MLAGALLLAAVWVFLLHYVPTRAFISDIPRGHVFPIRSNLVHVFAPRAAVVLAILLVFGLVGGWLLAGRVLAPVNRITDATRIAATGSLSHRIRLAGRSDEFRELADAFDAMLAHGTVWVTTSAHPESAMLTVENTGEQLPPKVVATLAEPFQRGPDRRSPKPPAPGSDDAQRAAR
jgi:HAMP domain-containing protein